VNNTFLTGKVVLLVKMMLSNFDVPVGGQMIPGLKYNLLSPSKSSSFCESFDMIIDDVHGRKQW
jgi:hypothetical protein